MLDFLLTQPKSKALAFTGNMFSAKSWLKTPVAFANTAEQQRQVERFFDGSNVFRRAVDLVSHAPVTRKPAFLGDPQPPLEQELPPLIFGRTRATELAATSPAPSIEETT